MYENYKTGLNIVILAGTRDPPLLVLRIACLSTLIELFVVNEVAFPSVLNTD